MTAKHPLSPFVTARNLYLAALAEHQLTDEAVKADQPADPAPDADDATWTAWNEAIEAVLDRHGWYESRRILRDAACAFVAETGAEMARRSPAGWAKLTDDARDLWTWASDPNHPRFYQTHDRALALALKLAPAQR